MSHSRSLPFRTFFALQFFSPPLPSSSPRLSLTQKPSLLVRTSYPSYCVTVGCSSFFCFVTRLILSPPPGRVDDIDMPIWILGNYFFSVFPSYSLLATIFFVSFSQVVSPSDFSGLPVSFFYENRSVGDSFGCT